MTQAPVSYTHLITTINNIPDSQFVYNIGVTLNNLNAKIEVSVVVKRAYYKSTTRTSRATHELDCCAYQATRNITSNKIDFKCSLLKERVRKALFLSLIHI